jgi:hypothetical protein
MRVVKREKPEEWDKGQAGEARPRRWVRSTTHPHDEAHPQS